MALLDSPGDLTAVPRPQLGIKRRGMGNGKTGDAEGETTFETLRTQFSSASRHFGANEEKSETLRHQFVDSSVSGQNYLWLKPQSVRVLNLCIADVTDQDSGSQCT